MLPQNFPEILNMSFFIDKNQFHDLRRIGLNGMYAPTDKTEESGIRNVSFLL